jgi:phosphoserine phosphatase
MRLLIFGDSITYGAWGKEGGWVSRLRKFLDEKILTDKDFYCLVYNLGASGDTTDDLLERFEFETKMRVKEGEEPLFIFSVGGNDAVFINNRNQSITSLPRFRKNIGKLISLARKYTAKIVFIGILPCDESKTTPIPWNTSVSYRNSDIIQLVIFDMDGVLVDVDDYNEGDKKIAVSTWQVVFDKTGIYHEHKRLKEMFIKGEFPSYMEWTDAACRVLQENKLTKEKFLDIIHSRPLMSGAKEALAALKNRGYKTAVITGSFKALAERAQKELGLDFIISHCDLIFDGNGGLQEWKLTPCDFEGKAEYFHKLIQELNIKSLECAYIGDEINDISIFRET